MPAVPALVGPCIDHALAHAPKLLERAIDRACAAMQEDVSRSASTAERQEVALAASELSQRRNVWSSAFAGALRKAIESDGAAPNRLVVSPSSLTLTLVDDSEVMQSIESSRLAQQLEGAVEKPLAELDRYMSSAMQLDGIQPEQNPLRPAMFAQALRSVMNEPEPQPGRVALWMRHMAAPMGTDLQALYQTCSQLLVGSNVQAADYRVLTGPAPLGTRGTNPAPLASQADKPARPSAVVPLRPAGDAPRTRPAVSGWAELITEAVGGPALREFLFGGGSASAQQPLAPAYYHQVDEELAALEARWDEAPPDPGAARQYQHLPVVERPVRPVGTDSPLSRETWGDYGAPRQRSLVRTRLRKQAKRVDQAMGIDVVRQLVDQVAQDPRLLAPVREAIVALEPSLARLSLHAPRFFGEHDNAARRLLEAVAQRSFKYNDEFSTDFQDFFGGVTHWFNSLNRLEAVPNAAPFEEALARLAAEWSGLDRDEEEQREQIVQAVELAEKRQKEADQIAWDLSQRSDLDGAPAVVQDFLFGPWALVIANARLNNKAGEIDPGGCVAVIADLLWSVKRDQALRDPARAFEVIPRILPKLRSGLALLGHQPGETESFFQALERLHRPVLKLRAKHRRQTFQVETTVPQEDDLKPAAAQKPRAREDVWLRDGELRACGFEDTLPSDYAGLEPTAATGAGASAPAGGTATVQSIPVVTVAGVPLSPPQADAVIATLQEGCWVDLFSKQRWRRARLTWASTQSTLFMFVSDGGRAHSMTKRSLQRLVMNRLLRPVDSRDVVQHALDALARPRTEALAA
jgi:hypothetical protein